MGLASKYDRYADFSVTPTRINGQPGFIVTEPDGSIHTLAIDVRDGFIASIYIVRNPDKLKHLARQ